MFNELLIAIRWNVDWWLRRVAVDRLYPSDGGNVYADTEHNRRLFVRGVI